jgi:hypothetical protein
MYQDIILDGHHRTEVLEGCACVALMRGFESMLYHLSVSLGVIAESSTSCL